MAKDDNTAKKISDNILMIICSLAIALILGSFGYTYNISNKIELVKEQMNRERIEDIKEINKNINAVSSQLSRILGYMDAKNAEGP